MTDDPHDKFELPEKFERRDPFDPNNWQPMDTSRRVYLDAHCELYCIVDAEDYLWAVQWLWTATPDKHKRKFYATRMTTLRDRSQQKVFLHKAILSERAKLPQPSPRHTIGDHEDGDSLNCRRSNLRWATPSMNRRNINGSYAQQRALGV